MAVEAATSPNVLAKLDLGDRLRKEMIVIASRIGRSIARFQKAAEETRMGDANMSVEIGGIGELKELSGAFERMSLALAVEQIETADDAQQQQSGARPAAGRSDVYAGRTG